MTGTRGMATTGTTGTLFRHHDEFYYGGEGEAGRWQGGEGEGAERRWGKKQSKAGQSREPASPVEEEDFYEELDPLPSPPLQRIPFHFCFCLFLFLFPDFVSRKNALQLDPFCEREIRLGNAFQTHTGEGDTKPRAKPKPNERKGNFQKNRRKIKNRIKKTSFFELFSCFFLSLQGSLCFFLRFAFFFGCFGGPFT